MSAKRKPPTQPPTGTPKPGLRLVASPGQVPEEEDESDGLTPREVIFIDALASGKSVADAAASVNMSTRSARRWKTKPHIEAAVRARLTENLAQGRAVLSGGTARAARALVAMSDGTEEPDAARVSACRAVVEGSAKLIDLAEIERQVAELREQLTSTQSSTLTHSKG